MPTRAFVTPEMLVWARQSAGMSLAESGDRSGYGEARLTSWERGEALPTVNQARELARIYDQPFAAFYMTLPPAVFKPPIADFRRLPEAEHNHYASEFVVDVRRSLERRATVLDLTTQLGHDLPDFQLEAHQNEDAEAVGQRIRDVLKISFDHQIAQGTPGRSFGLWRGAIERQGALDVQPTGVPLDQMRGYSIAEYPLPVIVVNRKDAYAGRLFTLLHEMTHLLLRVSGVCDPTSVKINVSGNETLEPFCNHVAGATLVPMDVLLEQEEVVRSTGVIWDSNELGQIAKRFGVSREAVLRRLLIAGKTTPAFYEFKRRQFLEEYKAPRKKKKGFISPVDNAISREGKRYIGTVLDAYAAEIITSTDVADYVRLKAKHLPGLTLAVAE